MLTITISSDYAGEGKSAMVTAIAHLLTSMGHTVEVNSSEPLPIREEKQHLTSLANTLRVSPVIRIVEAHHLGAADVRTVACFKPQAKAAPITLDSLPELGIADEIHGNMILIKTVLSAVQLKDSAPLTYNLYLSMREALPGNPHNGLILGSGAYATLRHNKEFQNLFDPTSNLDKLRAGYVGGLLGIDVLSDAFFPDDIKPIPCDAMYLYEFDSNSTDPLCPFKAVAFNIS